MVAYSKEMRREVLAACDRGEGTRGVVLHLRSMLKNSSASRRSLAKLGTADLFAS